MSEFVRKFLYVISGECDTSQISQYFINYANKINEKYNTNYSNVFYVSVVTNKNNEKQGFSYVWCKSEEIYNALLNNNFDGTERIIIEETIKDNINAVTDYENWGDCEEVEKIITKTELPPLLELDKIEYSEEQTNNLVRKNNVKIKLYSENNNIPIDEVINTFHRNITPVIKKLQKKNYYAGKKIMYTSFPPEWLTVKMLYNVFSRFNTDTKKEKGVYVYPKIYLKNNKFFIEFSPLTDDIYGVECICKLVYFPQHPEPVFFNTFKSH